MQTTYPSSDHILLVFLKEPTPGRVKTRLAKSIGESKATLYYQAMVATLLGRLSSNTNYRFRFCYAPDTATESIKAWINPLMEGAHNVSYDYQPQPSGDLGCRLSFAAKQAFSEGYRRVSLIGTDTPSLTSEHISSLTNSVASISIGPTYDGGYYLISMDAFYPELFDSIPWSSEDTYDATVRATIKANLSYDVLEQLYDIDELSDLEHSLSQPVLGDQISSAYDALKRETSV